MEMPIFSLKEEFDIFYEVLLSLQNYFLKIKISLNNADDEEEIEDLLSALYSTFVLRSISEKVSSFISNLPTLPKYGYYYKDYSKSAYVSVTSEESKDSKFVFVQFKTKDKPFDTVYCNKIDDNYHVISEGIELYYNKCDFDLQFLHLG
jgi:hypothetical protein